ncbi:hypothetical protein PI126_g11115 [Phytophthora idaei]|nr:hypothetical protein PI126_g11115 [Phytophthora idaei]
MILPTDLAVKVQGVTLPKAPAPVAGMRPRVPGAGGDSGVCGQNGGQRGNGSATGAGRQRMNKNNTTVKRATRGKLWGKYEVLLLTRCFTSAAPGWLYRKACGYSGVQCLYFSHTHP